jgi:hypothetical protein
MRAFLAGLIIGVALTVAGVWYYGERNPRTERAKEDMQSAATQTKDYVKEKMDSMDLSTDKIKDELARTGEVIRRKAENAGSDIADAAKDAKITTVIKAKLVASPDLSALSISVSTTEGRVTLSGTVSSPEKIGEAIKLAMGVDGVQEVVSTLQVKEK